MPWVPKNRRPKWFDISALLDPAVVSSSSGVRVRRTDDRIEYMIEQIRFSQGGIFLTWASLPPGYRPHLNQYGRLGTSAGLSAEITVNTGGGLVVGTVTPGQIHRGNFTVWTDTAQPTTHPGKEVD